MSKVGVFVHTYKSPHFETALEIAERHCEFGHEVFLYFVADDLPYVEPYHLRSSSPLVRALAQCPAVTRARKILSKKIKTRVGFDLSRRRRAEYFSEGKLRKFDKLSELQSYRWNGQDTGMAVASSLISAHRNSQLDVKQVSDEVSRAITSFIVSFEGSHDFIKKDRLDCVFVFNGRLVNERATRRACGIAGVSCFTHEYGCDKTKYSVFDTVPHNRMEVQAVMIKKWAMACRQNKCEAEGIASNFFLSRQCGSYKESSAFTHTHGDEGKPSESLGYQRIVTYFSSSDDEFVSIGDEFCQEGYRTQQLAVRALLSAIGKYSNTFLIIRIHPHLLHKHPDEERFWNSLELTKNAIIVPAGSKANSYKLIDESDLVFTYGSTTGIEAAFCGKPSYLLGSSFYDQLGCCTKAFDAEAIDNALQSPIAPEECKALSLPYGYYYSTFGFEFKNFVASGIHAGRFKGVDLFGKTILRSALRRLGLGK
ncbi:MAG: hypothetical protein J0M26_18655 [Planctomycetes bacterium]|nr:hypothetical protein [Planctomycetota bacterium]